MSQTEEQRSPKNEQPARHVFPVDFLWGASTSAYQIEGAVREDGRGPTIWDQFAETPGKVYQGETGEVAIDHYHRVAEDVALMSELGLKSYCFSLAWSRILPAGTGAVNTKGLDFYSRVLDTLLECGITPVVKLYHWDLPLALYNKGGWTNRDTIKAFADYAAIAAQHLGDRVPYWITHNEPWCTAFLGYGNGVHAPGEKNVQKAIDVAHALLVSHGLAVQRLRQIIPADSQIGIAPNLYPIYPVDQEPASLEAAKLADAFKNTWFLDPIYRGTYPDGFFASLGVNPPPIEAGDMELISSPTDFLAVNYYTRTLVSPVADNSMPFAEIEHVPGSSYTGMNWEVYPQGLADILVRVHRDYAPRSIFVTENGSAFDDGWQPGDTTVDDPERLAYLRDHVRAVARARAQGAPVNGYFAWSLMDNFEWALGYSKRFGIVYVDYPTQQRIIKASGHWYASLLARQQVSIDL